MPIGSTVAIVGGIASKVSGMFGPSSGFQEREQYSNWFFSTRDQVAALVPSMTAEQRAEWEGLSFHRVDYNTRRESAAERAELQAFVTKLQNPNAWSVPVAKPVVDTRLATYGGGLVDAPSGAVQAGILGGSGSGVGLALLVAAGVLAFLIFK